MKFTQQIKDNWLMNLKSGKYKQGGGRLYNKEDNTHCCMGVLGDCTPGLKNYPTEGEEGMGILDPYTFVGTIGTQKNVVMELANVNDMQFNPDKPDYSNVIPIIESLPVQEEE